MQCPGWVYLTDPAHSRVPSLLPGPGLGSPSSLSPFCPAHLSFGCAGSLVELSTCSAHPFHADTVPSVLHIFISRQINQSFLQLHITLRCAAFLHCSVRFVSSSFRVQPQGLFTTHQTLNRESLASSCIYLRRSSPREASLGNIREVMNFHSALRHEEI